MDATTAAPTVLDRGRDAAAPYTYRGAQLRAATFPLGGLGTGSVSLAGDGGLRQWQIVNNVNHDAHVPHSFFAIWAGARRASPRNALVLQCDKLYNDSGFRPAPAVSDHIVPAGSVDLLTELPGVDDLAVTARYPIVDVDYTTPLPVQVKLEAFSPFIPLNSKDSGLPAVIFNFTVTNPGDVPVRAALLGSQQNLVGWNGKTHIDGVHNLGYGDNVNTLVKLAGLTALDMANTRLADDHPANGHVTLAALPAPGDEVTHMTQWTDPRQLWDHFSHQRGRLSSQATGGASPAGQTWNGALAVAFEVAPHASRTVTFVLAWHFPNRYVTWAQDVHPYRMGIPDRKSKFWMGNQYANWFGSALDVVQYVQKHCARLTEQTRRYRDRFFDSTLPWALLESVAGPVSTLRTPTCLWLEDGRYYGFEGCHGASTTHDALEGCCPMNCTHVWNYEMALAKLFPDLEQSMRRTDLIEQISPWGSIPHRTTLPLYLPRPWQDFIGGPRNPAMDGEFGTVLKTYREVRHGADRAWFDEMWPSVKRVMEHALRDYDTEGDGVIRGEQPNTYDISIYGPNTFIGSLYLAALRAAEEMARLQGEAELAQSYRARFELGTVNYDKLCWTDEYYAQIVDLAQHTEMQFGAGCHMDQLLGQWWAHLLDLGYVLPADHVRATVRNIYRFNHRDTFRVEDQAPRVYLDARDRGLYICTWPHGGKPAVPTLYSDEVWTGLEYPVAGLLLYEGETDACLTMLGDIRGRHDGSRRSPWNEVECGDHYARAMASWALLELAAGYVYDAPHARLTFVPRLQAGDFRSFFITGGGWGVFSRDAAHARLAVDYGGVSLRELVLTGAGRGKARLNDQVLAATWTQDGDRVRLRFDDELLLAAGDVLTVAWE